MRPSATTFCLNPGWRWSRSSRTSPTVLPSARVERPPPINFAKFAVTLTSIAIGATFRSVVPAGEGRATELHIVDQLSDGRVVAAERALRVPPQLHDTKVHSERVEEQQAADERIAGLENLLDYLDRLNRAHYAGQRA